MLETTRIIGEHKKLFDIRHGALLLTAARAGVAEPYPFEL
jgi:hypothetical protein